MAVALTLVGFWLVLDNLVFGILIGVFLISAPWYLLRRMAERHRQRIEDQLADAMVTLANAVRAGLSLAQSMEILAAQLPKPINAEFHQIVGEYKMGKPLERTLTEARDRLKSENFALFAAAMLASHESGGRLNETVERIAQSVLELQRLERKVMSETAQARKSAIYMAPGPGDDPAGLLLRRPGQHDAVVHDDDRPNPAGGRGGVERHRVLLGQADFESGHLRKVEG